MLVAGVVASSLALVYASIAVSVAAAGLLGAGAFRRRQEIFGEPAPGPRVLASSPGGPRVLATVPGGQHGDPGPGPAHRPGPPPAAHGAGRGAIPGQAFPPPSGASRGEPAWGEQSGGGWLQAELGEAGQRHWDRPSGWLAGGAERPPAGGADEPPRPPGRPAARGASRPLTAAAGPADPWRLSREPSQASHRDQARPAWAPTAGPRAMSAPPEVILPGPSRPGQPGAPAGAGGPAAPGEPPGDVRPAAGGAPGAGHVPPEAPGAGHVPQEPPAAGELPAAGEPPGAESEPATAASPPREAAPPEPEGRAGGEVTVVPGIPRYHRRECILIRFLTDADLQTMSLRAAEAASCVPCKACQPDTPPAAGEAAPAPA
jgi:hypothetical protein